jgi:hypothetical protein
MRKSRYEATLQSALSAQQLLALFDQSTLRWTGSVSLACVACRRGK